jgi:SAM-dependent methyltransferase
MTCRFCGHELTHEFIDLGHSPPSNSFLSEHELDEPEVYYPLKSYVCDNCFLVQIGELKKSYEIFDENYVYFSSFSKTWLEHAKSYVGMIIDRLHLTSDSHVIEIASNDGYLLQYFKDQGIPCLGIEPASACAQAARRKGIEVVTEFFGVELARRLVQDGKQADLLIGNNVLAHVPNINDFVRGLKIVLKEEGVITLEFPHVMRLIEENQFDTIYHEHFSYFSLLTIERIFAEHRMVLFDVEELPTHGGSLRIYVSHPERGKNEIFSNVQSLLNQERSAGLERMSYYQNIQNKSLRLKYDLLSFLIDKKKQGKCIVGYGAAAKGNTLLNFCGITGDLLSFVADASPHKKGKYLPGSHIRVADENEIRARKPEYILVLPWNIKEEIMDQLSYVREWSGEFVIPIPELTTC